ncbi:chloramphenicol acetyltransferase [Chryseobacterium sp. T16E-39]|uniref:chloramphenicol acetyltransferase n=1 Tax=Chryseobacterium sp. T16E-39 TaxID=2015076 RepID=UPI000B5B1473|nr:chloramphenicol acetyltransferase [Chryseobacterium sp. T16E-39]ASK29208.1 chloramphenicol acetyltransferase [Chryseobacterium sp. T16E-39]
MKIVNVEKWNRKEHFEFFSKMASPYFGFTAEVDCTKAYETAKAKGCSFFAYYLHKSMVAVNSVEELKMRIVDDQIVVFDVIDAGSTIARADGTFGFSYIPFSESFDAFSTELQKEVQAVQNSSGLRLNTDTVTKALIRHSTIPWNSFSALLHPTNFDKTESIPKITFGKYSIREGKKHLPVSIEAHHGLADGLHLARYFEEFQRQLDL